MSTRRNRGRRPRRALLLAAASWGFALAAAAVLSGLALARSDSVVEPPVTGSALMMAGWLLMFVTVTVLIVEHRGKHRAEYVDFVTRFERASAQLRSEDPAIRLAGVNIVSALGDSTESFIRRQQCIDLLCSYLRSARDVARWDAEYEQEIRNTLVGVIASHLREEARVDWSEHDFNFAAACFEDSDFRYVRFNGNRTSFRGAVFSGAAARFDGAVFSGNAVWFDQAVFKCGTTSFVGAKFEGGSASLRALTLLGESALFGRATFGATRVTFDETVFASRSTSFVGATFRARNTSFRSTVFNGTTAWFDSVRFCRGRTSFRGASCGDTRLSFSQSQLWRGAAFDWVEPENVSTAGRPLKSPTNRDIRRFHWDWLARIRLTFGLRTPAATPLERNPVTAEPFRGP